jgi:hypothetical protein
MTDVIADCTQELKNPTAAFHPSDCPKICCLVWVEGFKTSLATTGHCILCVSKMRTNQNGLLNADH